MNPYDDEYDAGEAAREQARTPGNAHRRKLLNALLAAWDAHPGWTFAQLMARSAHAYYDDGCYFDTDADLLARLRALVKG